MEVHMPSPVGKLIVFVSLLLSTSGTGLVSTVAAEGSSPPNSGPGSGVETSGYVWSERTNSTHVPVHLSSNNRVSAAEPSAVPGSLNTVVIDLSGVTTPFLDVEVYDLAPGDWYTLQDPATGWGDAGPAGIDGRNVFWNIPATPGSWRLRDETRGEDVGTIVTIDPETGSGLDQGRPVAPGNPWCWWSCGPRRGGSTYCQSVPNVGETDGLSLENCGGGNGGGNGGTGSGGGPPSPTSRAYGSGRTLVQAAFSYTPYARVETTTCWSHDATVEAYVSGGIAAAHGTAGGTHVYRKEVCDTIISQGTPVRQRSVDEFQKDTYSDGSFKVYVKAQGNAISLSDWPGWVSPRGTRVIFDGVTTPFVREVTETNAGNTGFEGTLGAEAFGVGLTTTLKANSGTGYQNRVRITLTPPNAGHHEFKIYFQVGDQTTTGMMGMAWKVA